MVNGFRSPSFPHHRTPTEHLQLLRCHLKPAAAAAAAAVAPSVAAPAAPAWPTRQARATYALLQGQGSGTTAGCLTASNSSSPPPRYRHHHILKAEARSPGTAPLDSPEKNDTQKKSRARTHVDTAARTGKFAGAFINRAWRGLLIGGNVDLVRLSVRFAVCLAG